MTIEIKQLVIRAVVDPRPERAAATPAPRGRAEHAPRREPAPGPPIDQDAIVDAAVRRVMRELRRDRGR